MAQRTWPALDYDAWSATCDTLHAHMQILGKLAVALAPPEPQLQHAALRLTARGWETGLLPAPDGSGAFVAALDLHGHDVVVEHSDGRTRRIPLVPNRPVAAVTREVLQAIEEVAGTVPVNLTPQEVPWTTPLDEDHDHPTYDPVDVDAYFAMATTAARVLPTIRSRDRKSSALCRFGRAPFDMKTTRFGSSRRRGCEVLGVAGR